VIIGVKVYLRPIVKEDVKILNEWKNDEETFKYLGGGFMPLSIDQHAKWLESMMDTMGNNKRFIICDKQDVPIGMVGLYDINWIHRTCEIGVYLGNREHSCNA
jgi:diamine N-acetyltransferase